MSFTSRTVSGIGAATNLSSGSSSNVDGLAGTTVFEPVSSLQASSMEAPTDSSVTSTAASKKFYIVSHLAGSEHEISPTEEKAKAVFEQVGAEYEILCDKIRQSKGPSLTGKAIDINITRGTYRYLEDGIAVEESFTDLQRPVDFISPNGSVDVPALDQEYKEDIQASLMKIETLLRSSKAVNFGSSKLGVTTRPDSTYFGSSISLDSAATPSLGAVVKKSKKDGKKSLEYFPEIMQELLASGAKKETLVRVMVRFDNIQKYRNKFLEELEKNPDAKIDKNLIALTAAMRNVDWFAVAVGIAFRELANEQGIKKQDLEKAKKAIETIAEKQRAEIHKKKFISRIMSLSDVSETEQRARLEYETKLTNVISGKGQKKSVEEVLVTIACMETARNNNIPWASIFDGVSPSAAKAIKECDNSALSVVTSSQTLELEKDKNDLVNEVDENDPATLVAFVSEMSERLSNPPSTQATELFDRDFTKVMRSGPSNTEDDSDDDDFDQGSFDGFDRFPKRASGSVDPDIKSLIDMRSEAEQGPSFRVNGGSSHDLLD